MCLCKVCGTGACLLQMALVFYRGSPRYMDIDKLALQQWGTLCFHLNLNCVSSPPVSPLLRPLEVTQAKSLLKQGHLQSWIKLLLLISLSYGEISARELALWGRNMGILYSIA